MAELEISRSRKRPRLSWDVARPELADLRVHPSPPWREDDREGHYVFELGENLTPRYKIISKMGEGTFGRVLECWDREKHELVAIKVVRSIRKYRHAAMIEIDVLNQLAGNDRGKSQYVLFEAEPLGIEEGKSLLADGAFLVCLIMIYMVFVFCRLYLDLCSCLQIRRWFDYRNHICIVCEKLGPSLFDFLRRNKYNPFPVDLVREFGRQLLESVAYMHDLRLIHTDLKPENILLVSSESVKVPSHKRNSKRNSQDDMPFRCLPKSSAVKLIDFGSTAFESQDRSSIVSTRHYRAPEIILGKLVCLENKKNSCQLWLASGQIHLQRKILNEFA